MLPEQPGAGVAVESLVCVYLVDRPLTSQVRQQVEMDQGWIAVCRVEDEVVDDVTG